MPDIEIEVQSNDVVIDVETTSSNPEIVVESQSQVINEIGAVALYGPKGDKGDKGDAGEITSVTASVDNNIGTPNVNVTLGGTTSERTIDLAFHNLKGDKGDTGNGISNIEKTSTSGLIDTYTVVYTNTDTDTFTVTNGVDGQDGFSPTASVSKSGNTTTISITNKDGTTTAEVKDGLVSDVKVNNISVVSNGVANVDLSNYVPLTQKGAYNGVAELDANGKVPSSQLPSYVDDVIEAYTRSLAVLYSANWLSKTDGGSALTPETDKIYVIVSSGAYQNKSYRWSGTTYVEISSSPAQATESQAGIAEIATTGEVATGTDDARIVTPLKLAGAFTTYKTTNKADNNNQMISGTDDTHYVTPANVKYAFGNMNCELQMKTIDADFNTISNISTSNMVSTAIAKTIPSTGGSDDKLATQKAVTTALSGKQDVISDLSTIRSGASNGATAVQPNDLSTVATSGSYTDLSNKPTIPTVPTTLSSFTDDLGTSPTHTHSQYLTSHQDISGKEDTSNKVTSLSSSSTDTQYPSAKCVYDELADKADTSSLSTVATTGDYDDLTDKPTFSTGLTNTSNTITVTDYDKLVKNIATGYEGLALSGAAFAEEDGCVVVGQDAGCKSGDYGVALGYNATSTGDYAISIGGVAEAKTGGAYQFGYGTNNTANSFNVGFYNNSSTHYNYQLLDGTTGLIPDARISSNIARSSDIPAAQVQANWNETNTNSKAYIQNKPSLSTVATSGSYTDLSNKPTIPDAQIQADWNQTTTTAKDYIKNKPNLSTVATTGSYNDLSNKPTIPTVPTNVSAFTNDAGYLTQHQSLSGYQTTSNLVTSVSAQSTNSQYPSAKLFYDTVGNIETLLSQV